MKKYLILGISSILLLAFLVVLSTSVDAAGGSSQIYVQGLKFPGEKCANDTECLSGICLESLGICGCRDSIECLDSMICCSDSLCAYSCSTNGGSGGGSENDFIFSNPSDTSHLSSDSDFVYWLRRPILDGFEDSFLVAIISNVGDEECRMYTTGHTNKLKHSCIDISPSQNITSEEVLYVSYSLDKQWILDNKINIEKTGLVKQIETNNFDVSTIPDYVEFSLLESDEITYVYLKGFIMGEDEERIYYESFVPTSIGFSVFVIYGEIPSERTVPFAIWIYPLIVALVLVIFLFLLIKYTIKKKK